MRQELYIRAATAVSPQQSWRREAFLQPVMSSDTGMLFALDAPYNEYISPVAIRRMSRILKITISTAMQCLKEAGIKSPDAIITGTGRGAVTDMQHFVKDMIRMEEGALNPTLFIQSTYNSPNGWIAMQSGCTGYNQTYVHRGCSFELAVQDAQMMAAEADGPLRVLAGCFDEMTEEYYFIRGKRHYWKKEAPNSLDLHTIPSSAGTIGGEGSAFFVLSNEPDGARSLVRDMEIVYAATPESIREVAAGMLRNAGLQPSDVSLVLTGQNGDARQAPLYDDALALFDAATAVAGFKHLSGDYDTASGFGLWVADYLFREQAVPEKMMLRGTAPKKLRNILMINHYILGTASLWLISETGTP